MTIYYVATLARYVLVQAADENEAREKAIIALAQASTLDGRTSPPSIHTVRPATADEIEFNLWHFEHMDSQPTL